MVVVGIGETVLSGRVAYLFGTSVLFRIKVNVFWFVTPPLTPLVVVFGLATWVLMDLGIGDWELPFVVVV